MSRLKFVNKFIILSLLIVVIILVILINNAIRNSHTDGTMEPLLRDYVLSQETNIDILSWKRKENNNSVKIIRNYVNIFKGFKSNSDITEDKFVYLRTRSGKTPIFIYKTEVDNMISSQVKDSGTWEEDLLNQTALMFQNNPNSILLDLGCNIGVYTLFIAKLGVRVISVDPIQENLRLLSKSLYRGGLRDNVTLISNAISDEYSNISLSIPNGNIGGAHLSAETNENSNNNVIQVQTIMLDDLIKFVKDRKVIIKIDIEGFEFRALNGARDFFQTVDVRGIVMEWMHHRYKDTGQKIIDILVKNGLFPYSDFNKIKILDPELYHRWPENIFWFKR